MELLSLVTMVTMAFGVFIYLAFMLARFLFPPIEVKDDDLPTPLVKRRQPVSEYDIHQQ